MEERTSPNKTDFESMAKAFLEEAGGAAVFWPDTNLIHIVLGPQVFEVAREMKKLLEV